ncbi:hypothetical protein Y1Q_0022087 [Alligator mississippiensis]|uniref:Uncharacterized protein n=1 Tax=Alligator mississippiensis TaxID=8496 RepID=A0A151NTR6_ALLMI|nr:hypothetical protein Y1Q_0022087 [Alligator mississippiensis]
MGLKWGWQVYGSLHPPKLCLSICAEGLGKMVAGFQEGYKDPELATKISKQPCLGMAYLPHASVTLEKLIQLAFLEHKTWTEEDATQAAPLCME